MAGPPPPARRAAVRRHPRLLLAGVVLLLAAVGVALWLRAAPDGDRRAPDPDPPRRAEVWTTTADGRLRVERTATVAPAPAPATAADPGAAADVVAVPAEGDATGQEVRGFGAALTESSAALLLAMGDDARRALLTELFDPAGPVRLSVLRVPLGGSDFVVEGARTYDDLPAGATDPDLERFSTAPDEPVRSLLREIRGLAPDLVVVASPWSPPAWLKDSGALAGGRLLDDDAAYRTYAAYLVRALEEYAAAGVPVDALTVQNEPQARHPDGYPGTDMPVEDQVRLIRELGPALDAAGLDPEILAFDHNWALHPADAASTPDGRDPEADYAVQVLRSDAAPWVGGVAFHCYSGDASAQAAVLDERPDADIWITECSGSHAPGAAPEQVFADTLGWQGRHLLVEGLGYGASTVLTWNLALDPGGGPHVGGCGTCTGVVTVDGDAVTRNAELDVLAHASRFLPAGSVRAGPAGAGAETLGPATEGEGSVAQVAFRTPDGAVVVLLQHDGDRDRDVVVADAGDRFAVTLLARSLTTVVLDDDPGATATAPAGALLAEVDLAGVAATAEPAAPLDPCCTQDVAARATDGDPATRWSSGRPQRPGDRLDVDLGRAVAVRAVVLDAGGGDWPRGYAVEVSSDGSTWSEAVVRSGAGAVAAASLDGAPVRHLRVRLTEDAAPWWSVAELRVYE
ncbi:discoidin domain-containing protein [Cellulomonas endometrii]|uniref:discoidin domain-containing protein n=1 Tax=Cellulomonas endometrii TaxID=3036301 RepID=UPI0024ACBA79|nr:discoidin domain-containing protein [Cellulomonas endometrii]